ncbi:MAG TPA: hypothetical protein VNW23_01025, partial [Opitutaceae bacterium]|nr:hypothetical protein [Opitutaceae bacterium]
MKTATLLGRKLVASGLAAGLCFLSTATLLNANPTDPGVRSGPADAGNASPGLTTDQMNAFLIAQNVFEEVDSVSGTLTGEAGIGLGPSFNMNSCAACHAFPAIG